MVAELLNNIQNRLQESVNNIQRKMADNGINATGNTSKSIRVVSDETGVSIVAGGNGTKTAPIQTTEIGRPSGKVPFGFSSILYQWSIDKGIDFASDRERNTFSYFLSRRIAKEGTLRAKQNVDVYSTEVEQLKSDIPKMINVFVKTAIRESIATNFPK